MFSFAEPSYDEWRYVSSEDDAGNKSKTTNARKSNYRQSSNIIYKRQWNFNRNQYIFIQENTFEHIVWKMVAILYRVAGDLRRYDGRVISL